MRKGLKSEMYTCTVCGYKGFDAPVDEFDICDCCGTQFGYSDAKRSHADLRRLWINAGCQWKSRSRHKPAQWNPYAQMLSAGIADGVILQPSLPPQTPVIEPFMDGTRSQVKFRAALTTESFFGTLDFATRRRANVLTLATQARTCVILV